MAYSLGYGSPNSLQLLRSSDPCSFAAFPGGFSQARQPRRAVRRALVPSLRVRASVEGNSNSWSERDIDGWNSSNGNHKSNRNKLTGYLAAGATGLLLTIGFVFSSRTRGVKSPMMAPLVTEKTIDVSSGSRSLETIMQESGSNSTITPVVFDGSQDEKLYGETGTNSGGSAGNSSAGTDECSLMNADNVYQISEAKNDVGAISLNNSKPYVEMQEVESRLDDNLSGNFSEDRGIDEENAAIPVNKLRDTDDDISISVTDPGPIVVPDSADDLSRIHIDINKPSGFEGCQGDAADGDYNLETEISSSYDSNNNTSNQAGVLKSDPLSVQTESFENKPIIVTEDCLLENGLAVSNDHNDIKAPEPGELERTATNTGVRELIESIHDSKDSSIPQNNEQSASREQIDITDVHLVESNDLNSRRQSLFESKFPNIESEQIISSSGIPAPIRATASLTAPSNVLIPAAIDHFQSQAFAALQALKVIDADADPSALCTRREYARWLINSTAILARNPESKVFPAMFIENFSELAFDDVTPEDPDFAYIQGLAEAGLISSRLSNSSASVHGNFSPDCPLLRQDLVSWKAAIEKRELPEVDMKTFWEKSGFLDVDKIHKDAWPALLADISSDQSIVGLAFGYTRLFQPDKPVTKAQAAAALATGDASEFVSEELARIEAETLADTAVAAHAALEAQVQEDLNLAFKRELESEREKIKIAEASAEEAKTELQRIQKEMKNEMSTIMKEQAVLDSEREFLSRLRQELEEQLQSFTRSKLEISLEKDEIQRLHKEAASEKQALVQIRSEVEVEKKALALARTWVEEEAKKASEHARMLQEARDRWEKQGIKVYVDKDLEEVADSLASLMLRIEDQKKLKKPETAISATGFRDNVRLFLYDAKDKLGKVLEKLINITGSFWASLKERAVNLSRRSEELRQKALTNFSKAAQNAEHFTSSTVTSVTTSFREGTRKVADECKGQVQKISQKFKSAN